MRLVVGAGGEIGLVGRDQRQAEPVGEVDQRGLGRALAIRGRGAGSRRRAGRRRRRARRARRLSARSPMWCAQRPVDRPAGPAGQRDQAVGAAERGERDVRLVAVLGVEPERGDEPHEIAVAGLGLGQEHDRRAGDADFGEARRRRRARRRNRPSTCAPTIGWTPPLASFSENSRAPNRLLVSVMASAGMASALASLPSVSMASAPSRSEKAQWTCR